MATRASKPVLTLDIEAAISYQALARPPPPPSGHTIAPVMATCPSASTASVLADMSQVSDLATALRGRLCDLAKLCDRLMPAMVESDTSEIKIMLPGQQHKRKTSSLESLTLPSAVSQIKAKYQHVWYNYVSPLRLTMLVMVLFFGTWLLAPSTTHGRHHQPLGFTRQDAAQASKILGACNPFHRHGQLQLSARRAVNNYWKPFDEACLPSTLLRAISKSNRHEPGGTLATYPMRDNLKMPWLHNKTILMMRDVAAHNDLFEWCELMGGHASSLDARNETIKGLFDSLQQRLAELNQRYLDDSPINESFTPLKCEVSRFDLIIVQVFHHGMHTRAEIGVKAHKGDTFYDANPKKTLYQWANIMILVADTVLPLVGRNRQPDLIHLSTTHSNAYRWATEDHLDPKAPVAPGSVSDERITWYETQFKSGLNNITRRYPDATVLWQSPVLTDHVARSSMVALDGLARHVIEESQEEVRQELNALKVAGRPQQQILLDIKQPQVDSASHTSSAAAAAAAAHAGDAVGSVNRLHVDETGRLLLGNEAQQIDLSPSAKISIEGVMQADVMLYYLQRHHAAEVMRHIST
ncbi:uncharacterized protein L969DRAFT_333126 [Mixia osmundae IAM 14324]|uniref:Uncharacterized protein n=1 Tax=Mixia osmundae (strain CBS 9802 / IAM 14324 / JCM 22182 / KY 12970) TaxID=764103 RepID=G7E6D4_MIXOS|nr:uncharacterized protein L969DRAFT_333126 [Mixia osmundae IAM 14324]KEI40449.1 hypothetical protein L969DRAFT_333126 [Mixia osmundae IAM 14324]GAA98394.1 hypothetical protein E5Q_05080 [Mixia osmundae IAM 14324]